MLINNIVYKYRRRRTDDNFYLEKRKEIHNDYKVKIHNSTNILQRIFLSLSKILQFMKLTNLENLFQYK